MIRAVTFDADGTLWDFEGAMVHAQTLVLADVQARVPERAAGLTVRRLMAIRDEVAAEWGRRASR